MNGIEEVRLATPVEQLSAALEQILLPTHWQARRILTLLKDVNTPNGKRNPIVLASLDFSGTFPCLLLLSGLSILFTDFDPCSLGDFILEFPF